MILKDGESLASCFVHSFIHLAYPLLEKKKKEFEFQKSPLFDVRKGLTIFPRTVMTAHRRS